MKLIKLIFLLTLPFLLSSCVVSTAAKVVTTTAKIGYSAVKGTVKGISWAVQKAEGKIDEDRLDGKWKVVGVYNGSFEQFSQDHNPQNSLETACTAGFEVIEFNARRGKFKPIHCESQKEEWIKYKYNFGRNPQSKNKENYLQYHSGNYISVIDVNGNTMVLEGNLLSRQAFSGGKLYMFEKVR